MDLRTFVTETLTQIVGGIADAKAEVARMNVGAAVNPETTYSGVTAPHAAPTDVDFDVAVTVASATTDRDGHVVEGSAGGVLAVVGFKAGAKVDGQATKEGREETASRVRFSVKLGQPGNVVRAQPSAPMSAGRRMSLP